MKEFNQKYIGPNKIKMTRELKEKTYLEKSKVELEYDNGETISYPLEMVEKMVTDTASDLTTLREARVNPVIEKILGLITESELTLDEAYYATGPKMQASIDMAMDKCQKILWGGKDLTQGYKTVTLMDMEKVLKRKL
jgi:hypothetical protein